MARGASQAEISRARSKNNRAFIKELESAGIKGWIADRGPLKNHQVFGRHNGFTFCYFMRYSNASNGETLGTPYGAIFDDGGKVVWETPTSPKNFDEINQIWKTRSIMLDILSRGK